MNRGEQVEIKAGYSMDAGYRSELDEIAHAQGEVVEDTGWDHVLVWIPSQGDTYVPRARIIQRLDT